MKASHERGAKVLGIKAGSYIWIREWTMTILVGCSGWSYDDWAGKFYPLNLAGKKGEWFSYYADYFQKDMPIIVGVDPKEGKGRRTGFA
jgi:hypothetical protein